MTVKAKEIRMTIEEQCSPFNVFHRVEVTEVKGQQQVSVGNTWWLEAGKGSRGS